MTRRETFDHIVQNAGIRSENGNEMRTLEVYRSDGADFASISKWQLERMLEQAFEAGRNA